MLKRIEKRKQRRNRLLMGGVLVFLMIFGMMGIFTNNSAQGDYNYGEYNFRWDGQFFSTKIDGTKTNFYFLPQNILHVNTTPALKEKIHAHALYLTFDPESESNNLIFIDIIRDNLFNKLDSIVVNAMTKESNVYTLPIITCDNATEYVPVFYFNIANETSIVKDGNCIVLNSQLNDFLKIRDIILYTYYGVLDEQEQ